MGLRIGMPLRAAMRVKRSGLGPLFRFITRNIDLFIVPWLLAVDVLYIYLAARLASVCVPLALCLLEKKVSPQLVALRTVRGQLSLQAAAARVNLGYLMVSGAMALIVITTALHLINPVGPKFGEILVWLVIGQSGPVIFGATGLLMRVVERGAFYEVLSGITSVLFVTGALLLGAKDGVVVAQIFAAAQLTLAAICALLLTQCGIWPGITALFHSRIRLF
jgi:hypothetical protein